MTLLKKIQKQQWPTSTKMLKDPLLVRINERPFIIRSIRKVGERVMAKLEMDDDNMMRPFEELPENIQQLIFERIN